MKHCPKCGKQLQDEVKFCVNCGTEVALFPGSQGLGSKPNRNPGAGGRFTIIAGVILAVILVTGGFWGWKSYGTEAQVQRKLDLAVNYLSDNNYDQAILAFNDVIKIDPKEVKAYQGLARTYTLQGKYDEAQSAYDKGITAVDRDKKQILQLSLAGMYIDKHDLAAAEKAFAEIRNSSPNCFEAYWGLAMIYQQQGDNTKAEAMLKKAIEKNPNDYRGYNTLALFLKQNNKADEAFDNIVKSLSFEINQQEAYLVLSDIYKEHWTDLQTKLSSVSDQQITAMLEFYGTYSSKDYGKAVSLYQSKLSGQSGNQKAQILAAIAMVKSGDQTGSEGMIKQVVNAKINDWLLSDIALYYQAIGDNETAKIWAIRAAAANPANLEAIALLQTLNTGEDKFYAAEYLLYNWKPVGKVKEELQNIDQSSTKTNLSKAEETATKGSPTERMETETSVTNPNPANMSTTPKVNIIPGDKDYLNEQLIIAAGYNEMDKVKDLLAQGASPSAAADTGWTALHEAIHRGNFEIAKVLITAGANVNAQVNLGTTPLMEAAESGNIEIARILIEKGAKINVKDYFSLRALDYSKSSAMTSFLKQHGAKYGGP
ncbi:MAG: tetratricopeptide repeat protein [Syntrophomonadaceae bacterium]|nr:tetratricopeptide repeat protein [Syntrophomonadaceae bacterium]